MKFQKAVDLWDIETVLAINKGTLVLQVGQWVYCGSNSMKSRFISVKNGVFNCVHYPRTNSQAFRTRALLAKLQKQVDAKVITDLQFTLKASEHFAAIEV